MTLDEVSDFSDFGYEEISSEIEELVSESTDLCRLLEEFFGDDASKILKTTVITATEETECIRINFFKSMTLCEDRALIKTCTSVCY